MSDKNIAELIIVWIKGEEYEIDKESVVVKYVS